MNGPQFSASQSLNPILFSLVWSMLLALASSDLGAIDPMGFDLSAGAMRILL
jgi:hypothetical protein